MVTFKLSNHAHTLLNGIKFKVVILLVTTHNAHAHLHLHF